VVKQKWIPDGHSRLKLDSRFPLVAEILISISSLDPIFEIYKHTGPISQGLKGCREIFHLQEEVDLRSVFTTFI
jgi:hypothetical protein